METGNHLESGEGWGGERGMGREEWTRLQGLLDLVRREHQRTELDPERRERIRARVLERWERHEARRRRWRRFLALASALLLARLAVKLVARARAR